MLSIHAGADGLSEIVAQLSGIGVYLDNWAIIELANGDPQRRERFVKALKSRGSLLFSFTNSIELGEAEGEPAERVRTFLDEIGANWIPLELNPWTVAKRGAPARAIQELAAHQDLRYDAALHALESSGARCCDLVAGDGNGIPWRNTGGGGSRA